MENSKENKKKKVSGEELENVTGGTCYSKGKGVADPEWGEQRRYAIVSPLNICPIFEHLLCTSCAHSFRIGATWYCRNRYWENGHEVRRYG